MSKPINFHGLLNVYPPSVEDVTTNLYFSIYERMLTVSQEELWDSVSTDEADDAYLKAPDPFHYLLYNVYNDDEGHTFETLLGKAFEFFIHEKVTFFPEQEKILIGNLEEEIQKIKDVKELRWLTADKFFDFQNLVRESMGSKKLAPPVVEKDPRVARFKRKNRARERAKAKSGAGLDLGSMLAALCCMGIGLNPLNIGEISYCAAMTLLSQYQEKEKYDIDIRSLLAGADSKKVKPKYWIRKLDD